MQLSEDSNQGHVITGYELDAFYIDKQPYYQSLILTPDDIITSWQRSHVSEITEADLPQILESKPEIVLLGTGKQIVFPDAKITHFFQKQGIGFEYMNTAAACRTYNVLSSENRRVAAMLLLAKA